MDSGSPVSVVDAAQAQGESGPPPHKFAQLLRSLNGAGPLMPSTPEARAGSAPGRKHPGRTSSRRSASGAPVAGKRPPARGPRSKQGKVYIVGAGPGDPELLTLRALRLIKEAQTVVYDFLVGEDILALIPADAQRIYAGKKSFDHSLPQHEINKLLVGLAGPGQEGPGLRGGAAIP